MAALYESSLQNEPNLAFGPQVECMDAGWFYYNGTCCAVVHVDVCSNSVMLCMWPTQNY